MLRFFSLSVVFFWVVLFFSPLFFFPFQNVKREESPTAFSVVKMSQKGEQWTVAWCHLPNATFHLRDPVQFGIDY